jgi:hypothetical protein
VGAWPPLEPQVEHINQVWIAQQYCGNRPRAGAAIP